MSVPAIETFAGAAGTLTNPPWTQMHTGTAVVQYDGSGQGKKDTTSDALAFWNADLFNNDQYSQTTIKVTLGGNTTQYVYVICRAAGDFNTGHWYWGWTDGGSDTALLRVETGVASNVVIGTSNATTFANGDVFKLSVTGVSPNIICKLYKNGTSFLTVTGETSTVGTGVPGVGMGENTTVRIDDWEGGNMPSSGPYVQRRLVVQAVSRAGNY